MNKDCVIHMYSDIINARFQSGQFCGWTRRKMQVAWYVGEYFQRRSVAKGGGGSCASSSVRVLNHKQLLFLLLCSVFSIAGLAQNYDLKHFNQEDHLSTLDWGSIIEDNQGYLWISGFRGLTRFDGQNFMTLHSGSSADIRIDFENIESLYKLRSGEFAFVKEGAEIELFNPQTYQFRTVSFREFSKQDAIIVSLNEYNNGELFICLEYESGISVLRYDGLGVTTILEREEPRPDAIKSRNFGRPKLFIAPIDGSRYVFYDANKGYFFWEESTDIFTPMVLPTTFYEKEVWPYFITNNEVGEWLLSFTDVPGIYTFNESLEVVLHPDFDQTIIYTRYQQDAHENILFTGTQKNVNKYYLYQSKNRVITAIEDPLPGIGYSSTIWSENYEHYLFKAGNKGLTYGRKPSHKITPLLTKAAKNEHGISTRAMVRLMNGLVLVGSDGNGLFLYDPTNNTVKAVPTPDHWPDDLKPIMFSRTFLSNTHGSIWLTGYANSSAKERPTAFLIEFDEKRMQLDTFFRIPSRVESMVFINDSLILAGIANELFTIQLGPELKTETLNDHNPLWPKWSILKKVIPLKKEGQFYILTDNGLFHYDHKKGELQDIPLHGNVVKRYLDLYQEDEQTIWIATYGDGLYKYDLANETLEIFNYQQGIKSDIICGILPEGAHHLLLSTYNGLYRFDKRTGQATNQGLQHGLMHYEFNQHSFLALQDSSWLFGGLNGFHRVEKTNYEEAASDLRILLSMVQLRHKKTNQDTIIYGPFDLVNGIELPANARRLKLGVSAFDPKNMVRTQLFYRLFPVSTQWESLPENGELDFSLIPQGQHQLQISLSPDQAPVFTLPIFANAHFYELTVVRLLGIILVFSFFSLLYYLYFDRKLIQVKSLQLEENEKFRYRLFAYISHEFKTPLTVIFGLTNRLKQNAKKEELVKDLEIIEQHGTAMTSLVNQMIELNELEASKWHPDYAPVNLPEQLKLIVEQMQPLADNLGVKLELKTVVEIAYHWVDIVKLRVIVNNLLSNAIKFSPKGDVVQLFLEADTQQWALTVRDNGRGVAEEEISHIFEFFYRGSQLHDKGLPDSGIGLAYVKAVVEKMGGNIAVTNEKGAKFTVTFPAYHVLEPIQHIDMGQQTEIPESSFSSKKTTLDGRVLVLLIEDTIEVAKFATSCFSPEKYQVIWAKNGEEGKNMAIDLVPDIIVTDVIMPKMNGFEVCEHLKNHIITNHIPIIMLTALGDQQSKLQGLHAKADVYLSKPFRGEELVLSVKNLLYTRDQARTHYIDQLKKPEEIVVKTSTDPLQEEFIQKVNQVLEANYEDPYFGVEEMSKKLFLSRAQLHRKITAILAQTPSDLLRLYRLEKAAHLLQSKTDAIAQIASDCGFNDPSYFTKLFKEAYNASPSAYRKRSV